MKFDSEGMSSIEPWNTKITVYADDKLVYEGPVREIHYAYQQLSMTFVLPETLEKYRKWFQ